MQVESVSHIYRKISNRLSSKRTDWGEYRRIIDELHNKLKKRKEEEEKKEEEKENIGYGELIELIYQAVNLSSGRKEDFHRTIKEKKRKGNQERNPVKWWNQECQSSRRQEENVRSLQS